MYFFIFRYVLTCATDLTQAHLFFVLSYFSRFTEVPLKGHHSPGLSCHPVSPALRLVSARLIVLCCSYTDSTLVIIQNLKTNQFGTVTYYWWTGEPKEQRMLPLKSHSW